MDDTHYRLQITVHLEEMPLDSTPGAYMAQSIGITARIDHLSILLDQNALGKAVKQMAQRLINGGRGG